MNLICFCFVFYGSEEYSWTVNDACVFNSNTAHVKWPKSNHLSHANFNKNINTTTSSLNDTVCYGGGIMRKSTKLKKNLIYIKLGRG